MATSDLYEEYVQFKDWNVETDDSRNAEHEALLKLGGVVRAGAFLDIGFGRGELLDWAKAQGYVTSGLELIPELAERARGRGHRVPEGGLDELPDQSFDVITAIDVMEHLAVEDARKLLDQVRRLLRPDGVFIARFPNGDSPFSVPFQNGDLTHIRWLTAGGMRQLAEPQGLAVCGIHNLRPRARGVGAALKRSAAYLVRDIVEAVIGLAYFGKRFPMDPNVVVVLRPRRTKAAGEEPTVAR